MQLGRYEIQETIGTGASSSVSKARDTLINRIVAVKILQPGHGSDEWRERFLREARIVGQLSHPRIVNLYDVGIDDTTGAPYLVMEYITGKTLEQLLVIGVAQSERLFTWGVSLARALDYAHSHGIIHGDVKPANVLVNGDGRVKLADFGIARIATRISQTGRLMGTPAYLSPEQIEGGSTDCRSDLFSLGIILYQMATGQRPFRSESVAGVCGQILKSTPTRPSKLNEALSPALDRVIARCLDKNPENRFASGEELAVALENVGAASVASVNVVIQKNTPIALRWYALGTSLLVLGLSASLAHGYLHNAIRLPGPPKRFFSAPKPPEQLPTTRIEARELTPSEPALAAVAESNQAPRKRGERLNIKNRLVLPLSTAVAARLLPNVPLLKPVPDTKTSDAAQKPGEAQLTIEIATKSMDDTLAVFADHKILFRFSLAGAYGDDAIPIRRVFTLPSGPHEFSVGLYKDDRTLRSTKDGLGELRAGENNVLAIRIGKHSKLFPLLGTGLNVTWPSEAAHAESKRPAHSLPATSIGEKIPVQAVLPNESNR
jgi:serine/threonine protein kinase